MAPASGDAPDVPAEDARDDCRTKQSSPEGGEGSVEALRHEGVALPVYLHMFDAPTIRRIDMLVGRYLDRSDNFAAPDIKPCME